MTILQGSDYKVICVNLKRASPAADSLGSKTKNDAINSAVLAHIDKVIPYSPPWKKSQQGLYCGSSCSNMTVFFNTEMTTNRV